MWKKKTGSRKGAKAQRKDERQKSTQSLCAFASLREICFLMMDIHQKFKPNHYKILRD
jgi:hypothetical protein